MTYDKLDYARFAEKLQRGEYANAGGARRALGKVSGWTDKAKKEAAALIIDNKNWGKAPSAAPAKAPKEPKTPKEHKAPVAKAVKKAAHVANTAKPVAKAPAKLRMVRFCRRRKASAPLLMASDILRICSVPVSLAMTHRVSQ